MKESLRTFFRSNKKLVLIVFGVWFVGILSLLIVFIAAPRNKGPEIPKFPPGYTPKLSQEKIDFILNEPDPNMKAVIVSEKEKQQVLNATDKRKTFYSSTSSSSAGSASTSNPNDYVLVSPRISVEEQDRIMRGY